MPDHVLGIVIGLERSMSMKETKWLFLDGIYILLGEVESLKGNKKQKTELLSVMKEAKQAGSKNSQL